MNEVTQKGQIITRAKILDRCAGQGQRVRDSELVQSGLIQLGTDMKKFRRPPMKRSAVTTRRPISSAPKSRPPLRQHLNWSHIGLVGQGCGWRGPGAGRRGNGTIRPGQSRARPRGRAGADLHHGVLLRRRRTADDAPERRHGKMAAGDLDVVIPGAKRGDEIGDIAKTVTVIRANAEQKRATRRRPASIRTIWPRRRASAKWSSSPGRSNAPSAISSTMSPRRRTDSRSPRAR